MLSVPELETASKLDGTLTVQTAVRRGPLDPLQSARLVWALASLGALALTPEIHDMATAPRRRLAELRAHLRARSVRLDNSTYYDVLEITPLAEHDDIEAAYAAVGRRFAPVMLQAHDLGELTASINPMWELVEKARSVLIDMAQRGRYHDWLRTKLNDLRTVWAIEIADAQRAAEAFARGQRAPRRSAIRIARCATSPPRAAFIPATPSTRRRWRGRATASRSTTGKDRVDGARRGAQAHRAPCSPGAAPWPQALIALSLFCLAGGRRRLRALAPARRERDRSERPRGRAARAAPRDAPHHVERRVTGDRSAPRRAHPAGSRPSS